MNGARITETDLHAYVDGELRPERRAEVDQYLAEHPSEADRVRAWHQGNESLRALYAHIVDEPVPPRLDVDRLAGLEIDLLLEGHGGRRGALCDDRPRGRLDRSGLLDRA